MEEGEVQEVNLKREECSRKRSGGAWWTGVRMEVGRC